MTTRRKKICPATVTQFVRHGRKTTRNLVVGVLITEAFCMSPIAYAQTPDKPAVPATPAKAATPVKPAETKPEETNSKTGPVSKTDSKPVTSDAPVSSSGEPQSVTVQAERPSNRIDRQVYDVKSDVASTNGTAADALNNIPSVSVDPDGTVSLRGSTKVQILIDGKPSAMMQGDNRGASLNAMPSHDIESIEVINNPGAQFGNEGGGGPILNLVMRRNRQPGGFGVVNANAGSAGRYNSAVSGSYHEGLFGIQGGMNFRHDGRNSVGEAVRDRLDLGQHSTQDSASAGLNNSSGVNAAITYNIGTKDTLGANFSYARRNNDQKSTDHYLNTGQINSDYVRSTQRGGESTNYSWGGRYDHKGDINGEIMRLDLRVSGSDNASSNAYSNVYSNVDASSPIIFTDVHSRQNNANNIKIVDFTGDYERPDEKGLLKMGYKIANNKSEFDTSYFNIDPISNTAILNPSRTNSYNLDEANIALYGSYQLRLNEKWGVLAGLRTEYTHIDIQQLTARIEATNHYINYIPSFFASYKASDDTTLRFSYAHRIRRANANELNPFVVYRDELNYSSGNPKLKPAQTDSFELAYETRVIGLDMNIRGYYRTESDSILSRKIPINDTVVLTTLENGGGNHSSGVEFTLSGKLTPKLSINTSGNLLFIEQKILNTAGQEIQRSASSLSLRGRFNYQLSEQDQLQISLNSQGKTLSGEGYRQPNSTANFSLRHTITPSLNLVLNVTDVFNSNKIETIVDTDTLKEHNIRRYDGRLIYVGLSYRFGGNTAGGQGNNRQEMRRPPPPGQS
ncbi:TonB-dependent receptor [Undibacterium sp. YM2]|uniref:outer membrane beta-barrel family protein n=1 Tax=Undibacterium sp. YM2 TaxID=2058625 RepID=UPI001331FA56|nr:outer membrane beta-barrel family protein [Undibacterium sp. YM2]BBB66942.1 TonB-dependent receptor [Undibacterium sp. YM2]